MSMWFYFTIIIAILVVHDLYVKKMKNEVKLKEIEIELRKLDLTKQPAEDGDR